MAHYFLADPSGGESARFLSSFSKESVLGCITSPDFHYLVGVHGDDLIGAEAFRRRDPVACVVFSPDPDVEPTPADPEDVEDLDVYLVCGECGTEFKVSRLGTIEEEVTRASSPVFGSSGICPERKIRSPLRIAWL